MGISVHARSDIGKRRSLPKSRAEITVSRETPVAMNDVVIGENETRNAQNFSAKRLNVLSISSATSNRVLEIRWCDKNGAAVRMTSSDVVRPHNALARRARVECPIELPHVDKNAVAIRFFFDALALETFLETFVTRQSLTKQLFPPHGEVFVRLRSSQGSFVIRSLQFWSLATIW